MNSVGYTLLMENCIFCKIGSGELPTSTTHDDALSVSFLDINPVERGHILVIPKKHYAWMIETPDEIITHLFTIAKKIMQAQKEALHCDYTMLSVVGKDVPHFHIHLIPKILGESAHTDKHYTYSDGEQENIVTALRASLSH